MSPRTVRVLLGILVVAGLVQAAAVAHLYQTRDRFEVLSVERIDIVEPDGRLAMAISNTPRLPDPVIAGETLSRDAKSPGIIFYNPMGDEMGGLVYSARVVDGKPQAFGQLTFDQWQQDQTIAFTYSEEGDDRLVGLRVWDRPQIPGPEHARRLEAALAMPEGPEREAVIAPLRAPTRLFVGKSGENAALWMLDPQGRPRIKMSVGGDRTPALGPRPMWEIEYVTPPAWHTG